MSPKSMLRKIEERSTRNSFNTKSLASIYFNLMRHQSKSGYKCLLIFKVPTIKYAHMPDASV